MGKWSEVNCDCPNRVPLPGSGFYFDKPHRNKGRLTKKSNSSSQNIRAREARDMNARFWDERMVDGNDFFITTYSVFSHPAHQNLSSKTTCQQPALLL